MSETMPFEAQFYKAQSEIETLRAKLAEAQNERLHWKTSMLLCVSAACISDADELHGWIDSMRINLGKAINDRDEFKSKLAEAESKFKNYAMFRLRCDACGDLFNEHHQGDACPGAFYKYCKGTLQFNVPGVVEMQAKLTESQSELARTTEQMRGSLAASERVFQAKISEAEAERKELASNVQRALVELDECLNKSYKLQDKLAEVERQRDSLIDSFTALREFIDGQRNDSQGIADIINGAIGTPPKGEA